MNQFHRRNFHTFWPARWLPRLILLRPCEAISTNDLLVFADGFDFPLRVPRLAGPRCWHASSMWFELWHVAADRGSAEIL
jgi:hypothetical protein